MSIFQKHKQTNNKTFAALNKYRHRYIFILKYFKKRIIYR